jgi:hypothetical protein
MKMHRAVLYIVGRLVHLDSPMYGKVILHLPVVPRIKASLHRVVELKLEDIHAVQEILDVFPDDLPRMPLERVIDSTIELQLGTAPIAKAPYKNVTRGNEGVEDSTVSLAGQGIYMLKYITLGLFSVVCGEERQRVASPSRTSIHSYALTSCFIN